MLIKSKKYIIVSQVNQVKEVLLIISFHKMHTHRILKIMRERKHHKINLQLLREQL